MKQNFVIYGEPKSKSRPRFTKAGFAYTPKDTVNYENLVKISYRNSCQGVLQEELKATITCYFKIAKSTSKAKRLMMETHVIRPTKKPDCDNLAKIVLDALNGIAYHDDSQVVEMVVHKYYSNDPSVEVELEEIGLR